MVRIHLFTGFVFIKLFAKYFDNMKKVLRQSGKGKLFSLLLLLIPVLSEAQQVFSVAVQPSVITAVPPVHSGAMAVVNGKWIFMGGRIDGLHIMQSNQAFPSYGRNDSIYIVDPITNTRVAAAATQLPDSIYEALCSANMEFYQNGNYLYLIGGYGKMAVQNTWLTFHSLISVDLNCLMTNMAASLPIGNCFRQVIDSNMAVAGGMLEKIDSTYYLVFGHRFDGRYARNHSMGMFTQTYTHDIRKFEIFDDGVSLSIVNYRTESDTNNFHRRDLNSLPQIFPNLEYGFTAFGGVFQKNADLPFLTPIDIYSNGSVIQSSFNQNLSQYTCAAMPIYDSVNNVMSNVFFGGMSLYTLDTVNQTLVQDTLVPFVNTISKVVREANGTLSEYKLPVEMPGLLGSNSFFIPKDNAPLFYNKIINLNALSPLEHVGYIVGGIESDFPNIADLDPESMSRAHSTVYDVYIDKTLNSIHDIKIKNSINDLHVYPNPVAGKLLLDFNLMKEENCSINLFSTDGRLVNVIEQDTKLKGVQHFEMDTKAIAKGLYFCRINAGSSVKVVKLIIE